MVKTAEKSEVCAVYYDGSCPLCRLEIDYYQALQSEADFIDISQGYGLPDGLNHGAAMARFHIKDGNGVVKSGAAAFCELWKNTPGWRWLGQVVSVPPLVWIAEIGYRGFLLIRPIFQKLMRRIYSNHTGL